MSDFQGDGGADGFSITKEKPQIVPAVPDTSEADRLKAEIEYAKSIGIFGAPSFVTEDGEMFWGDDRLDEALAWARHGR